MLRNNLLTGTDRQTEASEDVLSQADALTKKEDIAVIREVFDFHSILLLIDKDRGNQETQ